MPKTAYLYHGSIYSANDQLVENPCVLIDGESDVILAWGNAENMHKKMETIRKSFAALGQSNSSLTAVELSLLRPDVACYIIRRMTECTASGFVRDFFAHREDPNALEWLAKEMERVPIALE